MRYTVAECRAKRDHNMQLARLMRGRGTSSVWVRQFAERARDWNRWVIEGGVPWNS